MEPSIQILLAFTLLALVWYIVCNNDDLTPRH